jgi:hypothetical protein
LAALKTRFEQAKGKGDAVAKEGRQMDLRESHQHEEKSSAECRRRPASRVQPASFVGYAPLLAIADPELYRRNPFRTLQLDVERTDREITRAVEHHTMLQKLDSTLPGIGGVFSTQTHDADALRDSEQRLRDPEQRFLEEFFWFWPLEIGQSRTDTAILALARADVVSASSHWLENESNPRSAPTCNHNLCILSHLTALDLERLATERALSPREEDELSFHWEQALDRWMRLIEDDAFWGRLTAHIKMRGDAQVTTDTADEIRESLPIALLSIIALLAARSAEWGNASEAYRHQQLLAASPFDHWSVDEACNRVARPFHERIKVICRRAKPNSERDPKRSTENAYAILRDLQPPLSAMTCVLGGEGALLDAAHDEVALAVLDCVRICRENYPRWKKCIALVEEAATYARSHTVRSRVDKERSTVHSARRAYHLDRLWECIREIIESGVPPIEQLERLSEEIPGRIDEIAKVLDQDGEALADAGNLFARALIRVSVELHNKDENYVRALHAIELAARYSTDQELNTKISEGRVVVQQHLDAQIAETRTTGILRPQPQPESMRSQADSTLRDAVNRRQARATYAWGGVFGPTGQQAAHRSPDAALPSTVGVSDDLKPVLRRPRLGTVCGTGLMLIGRADEDQFGSYLATRYFTFLFIPILPTARYRVIQQQGGTYEFLGESSLRGWAVAHVALALFLLAFALAIALTASRQSMRVLPTNGDGAGGGSNSPSAAATSSSRPTTTKAAASQPSGATTGNSQARRQVAAISKTLMQLDTEIGNLEQRVKAAYDQTQSLYGRVITGMQRDNNGALVPRTSYESAAVDQYNHYVRLYLAAKNELTAKEAKRDKLRADLKRLQERDR